MERTMQQSNDQSRSLVALEQDSTLIAVIEMSQSSWLVTAIVPGVTSEPLKQLAPEPDLLRRQLQRWGEQARKAGCPIKRVTEAFEAGGGGALRAGSGGARGAEGPPMSARPVG